MATEPERFVAADDVAEHLKIARRQVLEMTRRGLLPAHPLGVGEHRRVWRYKISEVEAAIASNAGKTPAAFTGDNLARRPTASTMLVGSSPSQRRKSNG